MAEQEQGTAQQPLSAWTRAQGTVRAVISAVLFPRCSMLGAGATPAGPHEELVELSSARCLSRR